MDGARVRMENDGGGRRLEDGRGGGAATHERKEMRLVALLVMEEMVGERRRRRSSHRRVWWLGRILLMCGGMGQNPGDFEWVRTKTSPPHCNQMRRQKSPDEVSAWSSHPRRGPGSQEYSTQPNNPLLI